MYEIYMNIHRKNFLEDKNIYYEDHDKLEDKHRYPSVSMLR
jgi:hypothetical protein